MGRAEQDIDERKLSSWKLLDEFRQRLAKVQARTPKPQARPGGPERLLLEEDYFSLVLFGLCGLFNPVIKTMRGLCFASHLKRVQDEVCSRPVSLGSFSEAQGVFDPELLRQVFLDLSGEISTSWGDDRLAHLADKLKLVDGSLLPALPRMHWALWQNDSNRAAKLHLKFTVLRQAPDDAKVTHGNSCERKTLLDLVKKGEVVVGDRYYGLEYAYFGELRQLGAPWVIRIRNNPRMEISEEMEAELIALIYRYRWQVELFFKWFKSILGCRHLMAESPDGVAIQIYSALIAALMLQLLTGKRPGKRAMELIRLYLMGYAELDEVITLVAPRKTEA